MEETRGTLPYIAFHLVQVETTFMQLIAYIGFGICNGQNLKAVWPAATHLAYIHCYMAAQPLLHIGTPPHGTT